MTYFEGTIIHGTLRNEDIFPALVDHLEAMELSEPIYEDDRKEQVEGFRADFRAKELETEYGQELVYEVFQAIESYLPDGYYCGALEGDGSDFGIWKLEPYE